MESICQCTITYTARVFSWGMLQQLSCNSALGRNALVPGDTDLTPTPTVAAAADE